MVGLRENFRTGGRKRKSIIPGDPQLAAIFNKFSTQLNILTDPPGAKVYFKYYHEPEKEWNYLGVSPIKKLRVPGAFLRLKLEKEGYEPVHGSAACILGDIMTKPIHSSR